MLVIYVANDHSGDRIAEQDNPPQVGDWTRLDPRESPYWQVVRSDLYKSELGGQVCVALVGLMGDPCRDPDLQPTANDAIALYQFDGKVIGSCWSGGDELMPPILGEYAQWDEDGKLLPIDKQVTAIEQFDPVDADAPYRAVWLCQVERIPAAVAA